MLKKFMEILQRRPSNVVGIDISSTSLKLVEIVLNKSKPLLKNFGITEIEPGIVNDGKIIDLNRLTEILRTTLATSGTTCRDVVTAVNGQAVFVREVPFPAMAEAEIREALKWDMENYVPYKPDSFYYDFAVVGPGSNEQEIRLLVAAAPHDAVDPLVDVIKGAGLRPLAIDIEPLALYRTLPNCDNSLVIDIGSEITQIVLFQDACPTVTRVIPIAGRRFTEAIANALELDYEEAESLKQRQRNLLQKTDSDSEFTNIHMQLYLLAEELAREIRRTVEYYQMQKNDTKIEKCYLTGGTANFENLAHNLSVLLSIPVLTHNPLDFVDIPSSFDSAYIKTLAPRLSVAIGLGMRGGDL